MALGLLNKLTGRNKPKADKTQDLVDNVSDSVNNAGVEKTSDEIKVLMKLRGQEMALEVLSRIKGGTFVAEKKFKNNMGLTLAEVGESVIISDVNLESDVKTITFVVLDLNGERKTEELIYSEGVFFSNSMRCFNGIDSIIDEVESSTPKTW